MDKPPCSECGDQKPLNEAGVCRNRHSCEHRQFQHDSRVNRLLEEMEYNELEGQGIIVIGVSWHDEIFPWRRNDWNDDQDWLWE